MSASLIPVIQTQLERRGNGKSTPIRIVTQFWSPGGELLAEVDPDGDGELRRTVETAVSDEGKRWHTLVDAWLSKLPASLRTPDAYAYLSELRQAVDEMKEPRAAR